MPSLLGYNKKVHVMEFYEWADALSVDNETIDRQHKILIGNIKSLAQALQQKNSTSASIMVLLNNVSSCARMHFSYEETLFEIDGYTESEAHKKSHEHLLSELEKFRVRFQMGDTSVTFELLEFLMGWYSHILESDAGYVEFLKTKV